LNYLYPLYIFFLRLRFALSVFSRSMRHKRIEIVYDTCCRYILKRVKGLNFFHLKEEEDTKVSIPPEKTLLSHSKTKAKCKTWR